ncbi:MAG: diaminopimelate decarboxylase, partial [Acidobacteriota bacterium]|nr:diaminopimelate decarboxylase [Acidobacteriota bacterium]
MSLAQVFHYRNNGQLHCEDVALATLAKQVGTPCYVYSKNAIRENFQAFRSAFERVDPLICYAVKANSNLSILRLLKEEGSGFDVVSGGELFRLMKIGADPNSVIFSGVGKTVDELKMALEMPVLSLNVESVEELETLMSLAREMGVCPDISLRVNPDVESPTHPYISTGLREHKFGIDLDRIEHITALLRDSQSVRLTGLGFHIGSQILDVQPFMDAFTILLKVAGELEVEGFKIEHLDLGGGIGIPYQEEEEPDLSVYADLLAEHQDDRRILFEPGRYIVGNTGVLLSTVLYRKAANEKTFIIVDGAMNDLIRPSLYQAYHEIRPLQQKSEASMVVDVVGPVCETGDFFARDRRLPPL